jgi:hypothetical protein
MYERQERCMQGYGGERAHLEDLGIDNIKMGLQEMGWGGMHWFALCQDRDRWWALVKVVMNLWFPQNVRNFLSS